MKIRIVFVLLSAVAACIASPLEHCIYDSVPLNGAWEMAYQPYEWVGLTPPSFEGKTVEGAVPGYWEDMADEFRVAGIKDEFRINPHYEVQKFPILNRASDTTLPNIYGCRYRAF